jgi:hypothetical protein
MLILNVQDRSKQLEKKVQESGERNGAENNELLSHYYILQRILF